MSLRSSGVSSDLTSWIHKKNGSLSDLSTLFNASDTSLVISTWDKELRNSSSPCLPSHWGMTSPVWHPETIHLDPPKKSRLRHFKIIRTPPNLHAMKLRMKLIQLIKLYCIDDDWREWGLQLQERKIGESSWTNSIETQWSQFAYSPKQTRFLTLKQDEVFNGKKYCA